ncbi:ubiquinol-cytochrome C chaperone family protein [Niveispirillum sp. KHB5.9]|uniref:ubiquinol-cytochrome C chaperone family protein n=1 Tax=Niveispirillum sp. KHB5.9 TaxID=3400269 RepID=UPI003A8BA8FC
MFSRLFQRPRRERTIAALYGAIVAQSRQPVFFTDLGVPDTLEGRFEMVALHAWLVMRRLAMGGKDVAEFNQALFDFMFADMDFNLRELGATDMKVGDKVKELASHYYGRVAAYDAGIAAKDDPSVLLAAIDRNLYGSTLPDPAHVGAIADYMRRQLVHMETFPIDRLLAGEVEFAP